MLHLYGTDNPAQLKSEVPQLPLYATLLSCSLPSCCRAVELSLVQVFHAELLRDVLERISFVPSTDNGAETVIAKKPSSQEENDKFREALEAAFEEVDTDNSGTLDLEELKAMPGFMKGAIVL